jgi:hypothetical protein
LCVCEILLSSKAKWHKNFAFQLTKTLIYHFLSLSFARYRLTLVLFLSLSLDRPRKKHFNSAFPFAKHLNGEKAGEKEGKGRRKKVSCFKAQFHFNFVFDYSTEIVWQSNINLTLSSKKGQRREKSENRSEKEFMYGNNPSKFS